MGTYMTLELPDRLIAFVRIQQQSLRQNFLGEDPMLACGWGLLRGPSNGFSTFACLRKQGIPMYVVDFFIVPGVTPPSRNLVKDLVVLVIIIDKAYSTIRK